MTVDDLGRVVKADLLVLGGGLAGSFAAITARDMGVEDVLVVDKGAVGYTNRFHFAGGYTIFMLPGDDPEAWLKAFFKGQHGLCYQDKVESLLAHSFDRLKRLEDMDLVYPKESGSTGYRRMLSRGLDSVQMCFPPTYKNYAGGPAVTMALRNAARSSGVRFLEKVFVNHLIVENNRVLGAVGSHRRTGEFFIFKCRSVVMASGDCSFRGNYAGVGQVTGDTFSMAYDAGANLTNMEFLVNNTGPLNFPFRGTGPVTKMGAKFLNASGEDFMARWHPKGSQAEVNYIVQGMAHELAEGKGPPFYFDFRSTPDATENHFTEGWMGRNIKRLKEKDFPIFDRKVEWIPVIQTLRGGLKTDIHCMSNINGLFAAGMAASTGPGLFNGWSSAKCVWTGATAGNAAAEYIKGTSDGMLDPDGLIRLKKKLFNRKIDTGGGEKTVNEVTQMLQRIIFAYDTSIIKSEKRLNKALKDIRSLQENELAKTKISDMHEFIRFKELENLFVTAELFLKASLVRKESRGDHYREDYPLSDNQNWLKWIVQNKDIEEGYRFEELPWEKYRFQPEDLVEF